MKLSKSQKRRHTVDECPECDGHYLTPSHDASAMCEEGKPIHCDCDQCF